MGICRSCLSLVVFWTHFGIRMGPGAVEEANDTIMGGVQCLNALLLAPKSDCVKINQREKRVKKWKNEKNTRKKNIYFSKFFSSIKKYKKSNTIGCESVPLIIKIGFFGTKKEHTFFGFSDISKTTQQNAIQPLAFWMFSKNVLNPSR